MAATDTHHPSPERSPRALGVEQLWRRLEEEIGRAERHGTPLCCLFVALQAPAAPPSRQGEQLPEWALDYVARALGAQLRRFDRVGWLPGGQLLVVLPGADHPRGEIVARRSLARLRAVKLERAGERRAIAVRIGLAAWREGVSASQLVGQTRLAVCPVTPGTPQPSAGSS